MNRSPVCAELGAYVLGVLNVEESDHFEEHLLDCPRCLGEIESLHSVRDLLLPLVGNPTESADPPDEGEHRRAGGLPDETPDDELLTELLRDVAQERRRRRSWLAAAVLTTAAALLAVVGLVAVRPHTAQPMAVPQDPSHPAVMLMMIGEQHSAKDLRTGVSGAVALEDEGWGTHVALRLSGVHGPLTCSLVAVSRSGQHETVTSWSVPTQGYGVSGHPDPLVVHGGTSLSRKQLGHFEVHASDGRQLLSIPL